MVLLISKCLAMNDAWCAVYAPYVTVHGEHVENILIFAAVPTNKMGQYLAQAVQVKICICTPELFVSCDEEGHARCT